GVARAAGARRGGGGGAACRRGGGGPRAGGGPRLCPRFRARAAGFYDDEDLAVAAAAALAGVPPALREIGQVVLFLPTRLSPGEMELAGAPCGAGPVRVVGGVNRGPPADAPAPALAAPRARGPPPPTAHRSCPRSRRPRRAARPS